MTYKQAVGNAIRRANERSAKSGERFAVVEIDSADGRRIATCPASYVLEDEFEAFCGEVLYETD